MAANRYEIRFAGAGGQGIVLTGIILAEAAAIFDNKNAIQSQSYGPEARGGASKSEVIISDEDIDYPRATRLDALLCLTQEAFEKYIDDLKDEGLLFVDEDYVEELPPGHWTIYRFRFVHTARNVIGKEFTLGVVALGTMVAITGVVSRKAIEEAVLGRVPRGTEEINKKALYAGFEMAEKALEQQN
jgi:2-oxoglutarate ferredoxin oxidoreductase subunit gamma